MNLMPALLLAVSSATDGFAATRRIHAVRPDIRILVLTSFGTSVEVHRAIEAGATGALVKTSV